MKLFFRIDRAVEKGLTFVCFVLFFGIVVLGSIAVFSRFVFNLSIVWAEECMRFACIWLVFIGSSLTVRKDGHVSIDILQESLRKHRKTKTVFYVISRLIGIAFLVCLFPASLDLIKRTGNSMAASLPLPFSVVYAVVPIGILLMLWSYIKALPYFTKKILEEEDE